MNCLPRSEAPDSALQPAPQAALTNTRLSLSLGLHPPGPASLGYRPQGRGLCRASAERAEPNAAPSAGPSSGGLAPPSFPAAVTHGEAEAEAAAPAAAAAAAAAAAPAERAPEQAAALRTRSPRRRALGRPR